MIELGQAQVDQPQFPRLVVNHDIVGLDITVHDTVSMAVVKGFKDLKNVVANVIIRESGVQSAEIDVVDMFEHQAGGFGNGILDTLEQLNDICASPQIFQHEHLAVNLLLFDGFENLDDNRLVGFCVPAIEDFTIFTTPDFSHNLELVLSSPLDLIILIIPPSLWAVDIDISVHTSAACALSGAFPDTLLHLNWSGCKKFTKVVRLKSHEFRRQESSVRLLK
mmetsp:Transcript_5328/g.8367  ORF Transcript_5328/g.8367 Transcript_5328/m.8367 type:complete len:222 (-) Transcript_5328:44-709(-)